MTDLLQWVTILASGGAIACYALYRDEREHKADKSPQEYNKEDKQQSSLFDQTAQEMKDRELTRV